MNSQKNNEGNTLSVMLMKKLLSDDYAFLKEGILNNYRSFKITSNLPQELLQVKDFGNPVDVLNAIKSAVEKGTLTLNSEEMANYDYLLDNVSINRFISDYKDKLYLKVPCNYFIDFLTLDDGLYDVFFTDEIINYKEFKKEDFLYLFMSFIKRELLYKKYVFQDRYKKRLDEIVNCERLDVEYLYYSNPSTVKYDDLNQVKINDELKKEVLKDMPKDLNPIKKAIYIYVKLCKILTYDPEFYALGQGLNGAEKHRGIKNIEFISPSNNEVVCYEFCAIYAKLIKELGFDYEIDGDPLGMLLGLHQHLNVLLGKYFVSVDSVTSILYGDMTRSKLNQPLEGIECLNKNHKSKREFNLMVTEVYSMIVNGESKRKKQSYYEAFRIDDLIDEKAGKLDFYSLEDKIKLLLEKANGYDLKTIDFMGYVKQLLSVLFDSKKVENSVSFSIVSDKKRNKEGKDATITGVFTITEGNQFYHLLYNDSEKTLIALSNSDINAMFDDGELSYIDKQSTIIPGVASEGRIV